MELKVAMEAKIYTGVSLETMPLVQRFYEFCLILVGVRRRQKATRQH
jgi:hypothetical protein